MSPTKIAREKSLDRIIKEKTVLTRLAFTCQAVSLWKLFFTFEADGSHPTGTIHMDNVISLLNGDLSIWGVLAMPLGVALCFGPAILVWLKEEFGGSEKNKDCK